MQSPSEMKQLISEFEATNGRSNSLRRRFNELYGGASDIMDLDEMDIESDSEYSDTDDEAVEREDIRIVLLEEQFGYRRAVFGTGMYRVGDYYQPPNQFPFMAMRKSVQVERNENDYDIYPTLAFVKPDEYLLVVGAKAVQTLRSRPTQSEIATLQQIFGGNIQVWEYDELLDLTRGSDEPEPLEG